MLVNELKKSFLVSLWFMFLTFPIMVIRVNTVENIIQWRWANLFFVGIGSFFAECLCLALPDPSQGSGTPKTEVDGTLPV
jgi:hypothetical protein